MEKMKDDVIYRQMAIDALDCINGTEEVLRSLPSAQMDSTCVGCRYERKGSVVCDDCSRFFMDRYERRTK